MAGNEMEIGEVDGLVGVPTIVRATVAAIAELGFGILVASEFEQVAAVVAIVRIFARYFLPNFPFEIEYCEMPGKFHPREVEAWLTDSHSCCKTVGSQYTLAGKFDKPSS
jgi:hypothetical protein